MSNQLSPKRLGLLSFSRKSSAAADVPRRASVRWAVVAAGAAALTASLASEAATGMVATSSAFRDGGRLPLQYAGPGECGGKNVNLPVAWRNLPDGSKSVVVTLKDPDGAKGAGVTHWIVYNIPAEVKEIKAGAVEKSVGSMTVGKNMTGAEAYRGACPPMGDAPHHYILTVTATDLAPGSLPAGLDATALSSALAGHTLNGSTIVATFGHR
jgi:Raf kinase inhibitor-like YbhB/YbcL family protein